MALSGGSQWHSPEPIEQTARLPCGRCALELREERMAACGIVRHGERREARARRLEALESRPLRVCVGRVEVWEEKGCGCSALMLDAEAALAKGACLVAAELAVAVKGDVLCRRRAGVRGDRVSEQLGQRRLAAAVGTDECPALALAQRQAETRDEGAWWRTDFN